MTFRFSQRSLARLVGVHPDLVKVATRALALSTVDFGVTQGLRTKAEQQAFVDAGKSLTMNSRHLTGKAIDVVAYRDGAVSWAQPLYLEIAAAFESASEELGVPIVWGGVWATIKDSDHFELDRGRYPDLPVTAPQNNEIA